MSERKIRLLADVGEFKEGSVLDVIEQNDYAIFTRQGPVVSPDSVDMLYEWHKKAKKSVKQVSVLVECPSCIEWNEVLLEDGQVLKHGKKICQCLFCKEDIFWAISSNPDDSEDED